MKKSNILKSEIIDKVKEYYNLIQEESETDFVPGKAGLTMQAVYLMKGR